MNMFDNILENLKTRILRINLLQNFFNKILQFSAHLIFKGIIAIYTNIYIRLLWYNGVVTEIKGRFIKHPEWNRVFRFCSAWPRLKLNTKMGFNHQHHHHPPTTTRNSKSVISQLLLTQFWPDFKFEFLGSSTITKQ